MVEAQRPPPTTAGITREEKTIAARFWNPRHRNASATLGHRRCGCNQHKSKHTAAPDPVTVSFVPLFHQPQQCWEERLVWLYTVDSVFYATATPYNPEAQQ
jgi:hypothetical protein